MSPVELAYCKKALEMIQKREEEMMVQALIHTETVMKEEKQRKLREKVIKAKRLLAKLKLLNMELEKTIKEIGEMSIC